MVKMINTALMDIKEPFKKRKSPKFKNERKSKILAIFLSAFKNSNKLTASAVAIIWAEKFGFENCIARGYPSLLKPGIKVFRESI